MEVKSQLEGGKRGRRANFLTYSLCIPKAGRAQDGGRRMDEHGVADADGLDSDYDDDDDVFGSGGLFVSPIKYIISYFNVWFLFV